MFYLLYEHVTSLHQHWPLINLMKYQTVRIFLAMITAMIVAVAMGSRFIRWMRARQGKGQPIREDGPSTHLLTKKGTPTMGGLMILAGIAVATVLWVDPHSAAAWVVFGVTMAYGLLGFIDDYAKVTKQTSAGLTSIQKLIAQIAIAVGAVLVLMYYSPQPADAPHLATSLVIPVFKNFIFNLGYFYVVFGAVVIVGASNAVNLTDGLDGLAIVPVMIAAGAFTLIAFTALYWLSDIGRLAHLFNPVNPAGTDTLLCYLMPAFLYLSMDLASLDLPDPWLTGGIGLLKSLVFALICVCMAGGLRRIGIRLKL